MTFNLIKLHKLQYILTALVMLMGIQHIKAQLPSNDTAWHYHSAMSDDFTGTSINTAFWDTTWNRWTGWHSINATSGADWDFGKNDSVGGGYLYIKADTLNPNKVVPWQYWLDVGQGDSGQSLTYAYQSGVVQTKTTDTLYGYGYIEIRAKFPSRKWSFWPAFWLYSSNSSPAYYNEVDITENYATLSYSGYQVGTNFWVGNTNQAYSLTLRDEQIYNVIAKTDSLSGAFHTYGYEWNPDRATYYFDGTAIRTVYAPAKDSIPQYAMGVILNFTIDPNYAFLPTNWNGPAIPSVLLRNKTPTKCPSIL